MQVINTFKLVKAVTVVITGERIEKQNSLEDAGLLSLLLLRCFSKSPKICNELIRTSNIKKIILMSSSDIDQDLSPHLINQQQIVKRIGTETVLIESIKQLITLYTQKISTILKKKWEE